MKENRQNELGLHPIHQSIELSLSVVLDQSVRQNDESVQRTDNRQQLGTSMPSELETKWMQPIFKLGAMWGHADNKSELNVSTIG